jgi:hypothetical protein
MHMHEVFELIVWWSLCIYVCTYYTGKAGSRFVFVISLFLLSL